MTINPTRMRWRMPTQRVDQTTISGTLAANIYIDGVQILTYPSSLNPGEEAAFLFADLGWEPTPGVAHQLTLTAQEGPLESAHSEPVEFSFVGEPLPPTEVVALA